MVQKSRFFDFFSVHDFDDEKLSVMYLPLFGSRVSAGFVSPASDYIEERIDLNRYLIRNPNATFFAKVRGTSLENAGVWDGDLIVVDRSLVPKKDSILMCIVDGEFTLKFMRKDADGKTFLVPANPAFKEIQIQEGMDFEIWGVVLHLIRNVYK
ncbi:MAG TPA: translesion error-prone DNA polymerase V autoproteolytic subunit [Cyclobacteriaceae bacterium]|nr:translesion error-prone DNA polymerase V autoproteolytic subunit [Cyclobacteriaceae bacterium]